MWQLVKDQDSKRIYQNNVTNGQCSQTMVKVDREGNYWFQFDDYMLLPFTRSFAATKISSLYALGLSKDDLNSHINGLKTVLKSSDADRYEKAYALVLDFETKSTNATDAIKQLTSLVSVYFTLNDEPIDSFDSSLQIKKMAILEADPELHNFFLNLQIRSTEAYSDRLNLISQIVSPMGEESS